MDEKALLAYLLKKAEQVNTMVRGYDVFKMGVAIPVPDGCTEEVKLAADRELMSLDWEFSRTAIDSKEYYVLFPLFR